MPLISIAAAAYAAGLALGFAALHSVTATLAVALILFAWWQSQRISFVIAAIIVAGHTVATTREWHDRACREEFVASGAIRVRLLADAAPGSFVRAQSDERGCRIRVALAVRDGRASYGSIVYVRGTILANGDGILVKPAFLEIAAGAGILARVRSRAIRSIERDFRGDAALAKALLVADVSDLGPEVRDRFAAAGLVHILSISGLHVTIVATAMLIVLHAMRIPQRHALIAGCALTATYVALIGAPPPAVRSAVMFGAVAASRLLQRPSSSWSALALGAVWPLATDARTVLDIGWQLTVAGMIALIVAGGVNKRHVSPYLSGVRAKLASEVVTGIIATAITAPIVAWYFGRLSVVAPAANIVASPIAQLLQPTLFLSLALSWWPGASGLVADAARPGLRALDGVASGAASLPGASFGVAPTFMTVVLAMIALAAVASLVRSQRPVRPIIACLIAISAIAWAPFSPRGSGELEMHAIDVGQADAIALRTPRGRWILVDAGGAWRGGDAGRRTVVPYIRRLGGEVALFVLTHPHLDHVGGAVSVIDALRPAVYWDAAFLSANTAYRASLAAADRRHLAWQRVRPGDSLRIDGVLVRVLAPDSAWTAAQDDPNNASTVLMIEFGATRFLLMGDAEAPEEEWMETVWGDTALRATVLKSGHHGSRTSSSAAFLDAVRPEVAVVSVGAGNTYKLPSPSVMDAYARRGILTLRTDELGTIVVSSDGRRIRFAGGDGMWMAPP